MYYARRGMQQDKWLRHVVPTALQRISARALPHVVKPMFWHPRTEGLWCPLLPVLLQPVPVGNARAAMAFLCSAKV